MKFEAYNTTGVNRSWISLRCKLLNVCLNSREWDEKSLMLAADRAGEDFEL
jgi:hypothetical protein